MNHAAAHVVQSLPDITLAYGVSDEYSFVFHRSTTLFERRKDKIVTTVVSAFTAAYVFAWGEYLEREAREAGDGKGVEYGRAADIRWAGRVLSVLGELEGLSELEAG